MVADRLLPARVVDAPANLAQELGEAFEHERAVAAVAAGIGDRPVEEVAEVGPVEHYADPALLVVPELRSQLEGNRLAQPPAM